MRTAIFLLIATLGPVALSAQDSVATLDRGTAYELSWNPDHNYWVTEVYISPKQTCSKCEINAKLRSIAAGSRTVPGLTSLFRIRATSVPTAFEISAPKDPRILPGAYQATLVLSKGNVQDRKNIQLSIPSGELAGPPSLDITRVRYSPFPIEEPELRIWETSGKTPVDVQVRQSEVFTGSEGQTTGQILIQAANIPPDNSVRFPYKLKGEFPLGSVSAKITFSSHQVQAPLVIPIQVRTRLSRWILLCILDFGLLLGVLMRTILKPRIETEQARKQAFEVVRDLGAPGQPPDGQFQTDISKARQTLLSVLEARDATSATIKAAADTANTARQTALDQLKTRLQEAATSINSFGGVLDPGWKLPDAMQSDLLEAKKSLERAKGLLQGSDAGRASDTIKVAETQFRDVLRTRASDWRRNADEFIHDVAGVATLIESGERNRFETAFRTFNDDIAKVTISADADLPSLKVALEAIDRSREESPGFVNSAATDVEETFGLMDAAIGPITLPQPPLWEKAGEVTRSFTERLKSLSPDTYRQDGKLEPPPSQVLNTWHDALMAQRPGAQEVESAFAGGQFEAAAKALQKALGASVGGISLDKTQLPVEEPVPSFAGVYREAPRVAQSTAKRPLVEAPTIEIPPQLGELEKKTVRQLIRDQLLQNVLSFVALTVVGYLIFADKFVGANGDLLSAFFWGFTTDIGLNALISAGKSKATG